MFCQGCSLVGAPSSQGRGVAALLVLETRARARAKARMGSGRVGAGAAGPSDDSSDPDSVSATSGPSLYTTSYSAIVRASCSNFVDASVMLVEVEDVGEEKRGYPANVRNVLLHILLDEPSPIDRSDFAHGSEQGVRHCDVEPLRLLRTKDG
jgi:hypothetical protein